MPKGIYYIIHNMSCYTENNIQKTLYSLFVFIVIFRTDITLLQFYYCKGFNTPKQILFS